MAKTGPVTLLKASLQKARGERELAARSARPHYIDVPARLVFGAAGPAPPFGARDRSRLQLRQDVAEGSHDHVVDSFR